jgi:putative ABC transport system ATP-binding protein
MMYELTNVTKRYRTKRGNVDALRGVDLIVEEGEFLAIQGQTGQGKSTLLQLLGGLDRATTGTVRFGGEDLATLSDSRLAELRARSFGFVFQGFNLIPTLTAAENVETALVPLGVPTAQRRSRVLDALAEVGLTDRATHLPAELSGGQQQRVAIARALVKQPSVILADEPTGNLDEATRDEIVGVLEGLRRDRNLTMIMVTHDSAVARRAPRRVIVSHGRIADRRSGSDRTAPLPEAVSSAGLPHAA